MLLVLTVMETKQEICLSDNNVYVRNNEDYSNYDFQLFVLHGDFSKFQRFEVERNCVFC